jgi:hypothetical protein
VDLFEPHNLPFAAALGVMLVLAIVQMFGLGDFGDADAEPGAEAGTLDGLATVLGLGRVPFTIWLALFLLLFAGLGLGIQELAANLTGGPLDAWLASIFAGGAALPVTAVMVRPLAAVLPQDESTAVTLDQLVGRRARVTDGVARRGSPARARVTDQHGHPHHVMIEPHEADSEIPAGDEALLVRREGETFYAAALAERRLSPH